MCLPIYGQEVSLSIRPGNWSDPNTWDVPPTRERNVVIRHDVLIDDGECKRLDIDGGVATLDGTLHAYGSVVVRSTLTGSEGSLLFHVENDRVFTGNTSPGPVAGLPDFHPEDTGLWALPNSHVKLEGSEVTPWLNAIPKSQIGIPLSYEGVSLPCISEGSLVLSSVPVGWQVGDKLLLAGLQGSYIVADLTEIDGANIRYSTTQTTFAANAISVEGALLLPKVGNLSRRLSIVSADVQEGNTNHRSHTSFMCCGTCSGRVDVTLKNVEFRNLGPRAKLGRYPIHFHHANDLSGSSVEGCSIWQDVSEPGSRLVSIHSSQNLIVKNNVGLKSQGHGFFMEAGPESGNQIIKNLCVDVRGPEELPVTNAFGSLAISHHYWLRVNNIIDGNVAIGTKEPVGPATVGLVVLAPTPPKSSNISTVCNDNEFYYCGKYGFWSANPDVTFNNTIAAFNFLAGYSGATGWGYANSRTKINNPIFLYNGNESTDPYISQIYLSHNSEFEVNGGLLVGKQIFHIHYRTEGTIIGTTMIGSTFIDPTYWALSFSVKNSTIKVAKIFRGVYPRNKNSLGMLLLKDSSIKIGEAAEYDSGDSYYTSKVYAELYNLPFTLVNTTGAKLNSTPERSGFIRVPLTYTSWLVAPLGKESILSLSPFFMSERNEATWNLLSDTLGYPYGFPPGVYTVKVVATNGTSETKQVTVVSGQITDF
jgi:hypothetical protein